MSEEKLETRWKVRVAPITEMLMRMQPEYVRALDYRLERIIRMCELSVSRPNENPVFAAPLSRGEGAAHVTEKFGLGGPPDAALEKGVSAPLLVAMAIARNEPVAGVASGEREERRELRDAGEDAAVAIRQSDYFGRMRRRGSGVVRRYQGMDAAEGGGT